MNEEQVRKKTIEIIEYADAIEQLCLQFTSIVNRKYVGIANIHKIENHITKIMDAACMIRENILKDCKGGE